MSDSNKSGNLSLVLLVATMGLCAIPIGQLFDFAFEFNFDNGFRSAGLTWGLSYLEQLALYVSIDFFRYFAAGLLLAVFFNRAAARNGGRLRRTIITGAVVCLFSGGTSWFDPLPLSVFPPLLLRFVGMLAGEWVGRNWAQKTLWRWTTIFKISAGTLIAATILVTAILQLTTVAPDQFAVTETGASGERVALRALLHEDGPENEHEVDLSLSEVNGLLQTVAVEFSIAKRLQVVASEGGFQSELVIPAFEWQGERRYFHAICRFQIWVASGRLSSQINGLEVGKHKLFPSLLRPLEKAFLASLQKTPKIRRVLAKIRSLSMHRGNLSVKTDVPIRVLALSFNLKQSLNSPALENAVHAQFDLLNEMLRYDLRTPVPLEEALSHMMSLAEERSQSGDPVIENQGAILVLGIFTGPTTLVQSLPYEIPEFLPRAGGRLRVLDRADWARHFCTSAAMVTMFDQSFSKLIGLIKEDLDADDAKRGFSFADLSVDRAGSRFTEYLTKSEKQARTAQTQLQMSPKMSGFVGDPNQWPEDINRDDFLSIYGGIGGAKFTQISHQIDQSLNELAVYQFEVE